MASTVTSAALLSAFTGGRASDEGDDDHRDQPSTSRKNTGLLLVASNADLAAAVGADPIGALLSTWSPCRSSSSSR